MASNFNMKAAHRDGKTEFTIGIDENAKIIDGIGEEILISNKDGSPAKIAKENIPYMPENVSETNRLVTQQDLKDMMENISNIMNAAEKLAIIVGGIDGGNNE